MPPLDPNPVVANSGNKNGSTVNAKQLELPVVPVVTHGQGWHKGGAAKVVALSAYVGHGKGAAVDDAGAEFAVGDGAVLNHAGKTPPGQAKKAARVRVTPLGAERGKGLGLIGAPFQMESADTAAGALVVRADLPIAEFLQGQSQDWEARLTLMAYPACILTTPKEPACLQGEAVPSVVDEATGVLSAEIVLDDTVTEVVAGGGKTSGRRVAAASGGGGSVYGLGTSYSSQYGSWSATPLSSSASWSVGLQSGSFDWSYAMPTSPTGYGSSPQVKLTYSSGAVDGVVSDGNTQGGLLGHGWNFQAGGYIERSYQTCQADASGSDPVFASMYDFCWGTEPSGQFEFLTLVLNGRSSKLVPTTTNGSEYRLEDDPAWKVVKLTGAGAPDNDGEYFVVATPDGTKYSFGSQPAASQSTWQVPVYGNHAGEPCNSTNLGASFCMQGWRFNLDLIQDTNGNRTDFFYGREENYYGKGLFADPTLYVRGGYPLYIKYGRNDAFTAGASRGQVHFAPKERCISTDTACVWPGGDATRWYVDAPSDLECGPAPATCSKRAPSFFTKKVITQIKSGPLDAAGNFTTVYQLNIALELPDSDGWGGMPAQLWLRELALVGGPGTNGQITLPATRFESYTDLLDNRADAIYVPYWRIDQINDEHGGRVDVTYGQPYACTQSPPAGGWQNNDQDCYPRWTVNAGQVGWGTFNKFVVTKTVESDLVAGQGAITTLYNYLTPPRWHHDDDPLIPAGNRSWGDFRGHNGVETRVGSGATTENVRHFFFTGMNADSMGAGNAARSVTYTDSKSAGFTDHPFLRGREYETEIYNSTIYPIRYEYSRYQAQFTAPNLAAAMVEQNEHISATFDSTSVSWPEVRSTTSFDGYGNPLQSIEYGSAATAADDRCTSTVYPLANVSGWIVSLPASVTLFANATCSGAKMSSTQFGYDTQVIGGMPTKGNLTLSRATLDDAGAFADTKFEYDAAGHQTKVTDPNLHSTTTAYQASLGYVTSQSNSLWQTSSYSFYDTRCFQPTIVQDQRTLQTRYSYDALCRLSTVYTPTDPVSFAAPVSFTYNVSKTQPSWVKTTVQQATTIPYSQTPLDSWVFSDGLGRSVQSQVPAPNGGRLVATSVYDDRGHQVRSIAAYQDPGTAGSGYVAIPTTSLNEDRAVYDGMGRATSVQHWTGTSQLWATGYAYDALTTTITPPDRSYSKEITDSFGRLQTHIDNGPSGDQTTSYAYDAADRLVSMTDPIGKVTSTTYNLVGWPKQNIDPDKGTTTFGYDGAGNLQSTTTPTGTIWNVYDAINRQIERRDGSATGTLLAQWAYDRTGETGLLDYSVAYNNGAAYKIDPVNPANATSSAYDGRNRTNGVTYTIPSQAGVTDNGLAGSYTYAYSYDRADHQTTIAYPAGGGLPAETVTTAFNNLGVATTLTSDVAGSPPYVSGTTFENWGPVKTRTLGAAATTNSVLRTYGWDQPTGHLVNQKADKYTSATTTATIQNLTYGYKVPSLLSSVTDTVAGERQCYGYDNRARLTTAYTTTTANACTAYAAAGPAPYNNSYAYDTASRMTTGPGGPTYTYADPAHPYAPSSIVTPGGTDTYTYDAAGNRTGWNNADGPDATYTWDTLGRLTSTSVTTDTTVTAPAYRDQLAGATTTPQTALSLTKPTNAQTGDLLVATIASSATAGGTTGPAPAFRAATSAQTATTTLSIPTPPAAQAADTLLAAITTSAPTTGGGGGGVAVEYQAEGPVPASGAYSTTIEGAGMGTYDWCTGLADPCHAGQAVGGFNGWETPYSLTWTLNNQTAGTYTVSFRYGGGYGNAARNLLVNGTQIQLVPFTATCGGCWGQTATVNVTLAAGTNTIKLATPGGPAAGEYLDLDSLTLTPTSTASSPAVVTPPSGWTLVTSAANTTTATSVYRHQAASGDPTTIAFTLSAATKAVGVVTAYSGTNPTNPIDTSSTANNTNATSHNTPSVTTTGTNRTLITYLGSAADTTTTPAAGMTERSDQAATTGAPTVALETADQTLSASGATGTRTHTTATATATNAITIALTPPTTTGGGGGGVAVEYQAEGPVPASGAYSTTIEGAGMGTYDWCTGLADPCHAGQAVGGFNGWETPYSLTWTLNNQTAGTYTVSFRYGGGYGNAARNLLVNGTQIQLVPFTATCGGCWGQTATVNVTLAAGTNTIKLATPGGPAAGEFLDLDSLTLTPTSTGGGTGGAPPTVTPPSGWTLIGTSDVTSGGVRLSTYQHVLAATDVSPWTFNQTSAATAVYAITAYSGVEAANPVEAIASKINTTGTSHPATPTTPAGTNRRLVIVTATDTAATITPDPSLTGRVTKSGPATAPTVAVELADKTAPTATPSGTLTAQTVTPAASAVLAFNLRPAQPAAAVTSNIYDTTNNRLIRKTPDGAVTLYLPGMEITHPATGTNTATRYYTIAGTTVATRTTSGTITWLLGDYRGSVTTTSVQNTGATASRYYTPYGAPRTTNTLTTQHGYLGQTEDPTTGLTYLNNRYQDPTTGVFLSVDPLVATTGTPYLYGNGNPTTLSDPSGLDPDTDARVRAQAKSNGSCTYSATVSGGNVCGANGVYYGSVNLPKKGSGARSSMPLTRTYVEESPPCASLGPSASSCQSQYVRTVPYGTTGSLAANTLLGKLFAKAFAGAVLGAHGRDQARQACGASFGIGPSCGAADSMDAAAAGLDKIDSFAGGALIDYVHATAVYGCGSSAGGASITCVDSQRLPTFDTGMNRVTYGHYVFCEPACADAGALRHEFVHVNQYEQNGDQMAAGYLYQWMLAGFDYRSNPYEVEAYNVGG